MPLFHEFNLMAAFALLLLWAVGGRLIALRAFELEAAERPLVGLALGMVLSTWLTNFVARWTAIGPATWISAGVTLAFGLALAYPRLRQAPARPSIQVGRWLAFLALALLFTLIGRGLAIFDDYQNLPFLSRIAAGDLPPHFPFDAGSRLGYHYFLLLLASEWMGAARALPWAALDLARGTTMALTFLLVGQFALRLTRKPVVEWAAVGFSALAGGTRWLMLFLPVALMAHLSDSIELIGSGVRTGANLAEALIAPWSLVGDGPIAIPFAFASGVFPPRILALSGTGVGSLLVIILIVLTGDRVRSAMGWGVISLLFASLALLSEPAFGLLLIGVLAVVGARMLRERPVRLSPPSGGWLLAIAAAAALAAVQGGLLTELALRVLNGPSGQASYYDVAFRLVWPPAVVSSHLGVLPLTSPLGLLAALLEFGPIVLAFPLVLAHGLRAWKEGRQAEAALAAGGLVSLAMVLVRYSGVAGPTATTRLYGLFGEACLIFAVPLGWRWLEGRRGGVQAAGALAALAAVFGGLVVLGSQLVAVPRPVASYFLTDLDAQMYRRHWNALPADAVVFDPTPSRAVTVLGRVVESQADLSGPTEEFTLLADDPDPSRLSAAGFDFLYADRAYWDRHSATLADDCLVWVDEAVDIHSATGDVGDFRRLVDLRGCR